MRPNHPQNQQQHSVANYANTKKLRANVGASILQNFDQAEKALQVAQNSAGSAAKEHDRWMQSIAASEAKAEAAFEQFSNKVLSSDLIKMGYNAQTGILGFLSNIIDLSGSAIPLITTLASGILSLTNNIGISKVNMPCLTWYGVAA